jgi:hypothetical protein
VARHTEFPTESSGCSRAYIDGRKVCFDDWGMDTWSALWLEDIIEDLDFEKAGRMDVY